MSGYLFLFSGKLALSEFRLMKGGYAIIPSLYFDVINAAILKFQREVTDPKAMVLPTFNTVGNIVRVPVLIPFWLSLTHRTLGSLL
jgi:hypothetical protein